MATIIDMPKMSDTMTVGTLVSWLKKEGDQVAAGDILAEVETDKATMEVENFEEGVLLKHYADKGEEIPVGAPLCAIGDKGEEPPPAPEKPAAKKSAPEKKPAREPLPKKPEAASESPDEGAGKEAAKEEPASEQPQTRASTPPERAPEDGRVKASPLAKRIAKEKGVDIARVQGTGPGGRIVKADVEAAAQKGSAQASSAPSFAVSGGSLPGAPIAEAADIPVSSMRRVIAERLVESKTTVPHFYLEIEIDAAPLMELRAAVNSSLEKIPPEQGGGKLTVNDFILKAAAEALRRVPAANRSWMGDHLRQHGEAHIAFGVAIDEGLVTPVIRSAQNMTLRQLALEAKSLISKARGKKLKPDEMSGSTLTVTNLGMYGIRCFYGVINPPNAAILSIGATEKKPVVGENGQIVVGQRMAIGLSGDHRAIDGAVGAEYLQALKQMLETPALMLI